MNDETRCPMCGQSGATLIEGTSAAEQLRYRVQLELALREALDQAESAYEDQRTSSDPLQDGDLVRLRGVLRSNATLDAMYAAGDRAGKR